MILLCGMGNKQRGDDGFGPYIIEHVRESDAVKKIDCHLFPENYLNKMVSRNPDVIIFFDAVRGIEKRTVFLENSEITECSTISITTHNLPFSAIYDYIKQYSKAKIWFFGVKPLSYEVMSHEVLELADGIVEFFNTLDKEEKANIIDVYENLSTTLR
jgi:hydrogenase maturation protease